MATHVIVTFFKDGGKWYTTDEFDTDTRCFETAEIISDAKNPDKCKHAHLANSMDFTFEASEGEATNFRLVKL